MRSDFSLNNLYSRTTVALRSPMVCGHKYSKNMDQPGKVASPARGS